MTSEQTPVFLALGGAAEIGMNLYAYGYGPEKSRRWIVVDVGVTFPDEGRQPGVDLIFADIAFLEAQAENIDGIFITHAHEDHVGALSHLAGRLGNAPIYARMFTSEIARLKLSESDVPQDRIETVAAWPETVAAGPFRVGFLPISHSIPESSMLVIDTPAGRILHTGDWKADPTPLIGEPYDPGMIATVAEDGILALICDSTNIFSPDLGRSEADIIAPIEALMANEPGMIVATTFASNIARLRTLSLAAQKAGRTVVVIGRAMHRMISTARKTGLLTDFPDITDVRDAEGIPAEHLFILASGSQGEGRAASAQLARGGYGRLSLREGDVFLFSSKTIPGNEVSVGEIQNLLAAQGVRVVDDARGLYHVSGHANRPDLLALHDLVKPKGLVPMHGEYRHLAEHARAALHSGIPSVVAPNGSLVALTQDGPRIIEHIETGRLYLDGSQIYGAMDGIVRDRLRMSWRGHVVVNLVFDGQDALMGDAWVETRGLFTDLDGAENALQTALEESVTIALSKAKKAQRGEDDQVEKIVKGRINTTTQQLIGKKPEITVMINRID